jgi:hypothetical protein
MPAWIHNRAMNLTKDMKASYVPGKVKQVAFVTTTQQAHASDKSPKTFIPKSEYKKTAEAKWKTMLRTGRLGGQEVSKLMERGTLDLAKEFSGQISGVNALQARAAKKGRSLDMFEAMEQMKHLHEGRVKTASAITFDGFANELEKIAIGRTRLNVSNIVGIQKANPASWFQRARKFITGTSRSGAGIKARVQQQADVAARTRRAAAEAGPEAFAKWKAAQ